MIVIKLAAALLLANASLACVKARRGTERSIAGLNDRSPVLGNSDKLPGKPIAASRSDLEAVESLLGPKVQLFGYEPTGYEEEAGGPITQSSSLKCDFDSECCWQNSGAPLDQLEWAIAQGEVSVDKLGSRFNSADAGPNGNYLLVIGSTAAADEAQFSSCSIPCTESDIRVTLKHWQTTNVLLQVCTRDSFYNDPVKAPLLNCVEVSPSASPGPTTVTLPASKLVDIVLVASNLVAPNWDGVLVDDIHVAYTPCNANEDNRRRVPLLPNSEALANMTSKERSALSNLGSNCAQIPCNFESDFCAYQQSNKLMLDPMFENVFLTNVPFDLASGQYENVVTGIPGPSSGEKYAAVYLQPIERTALVTVVDMGEPIVVSIDYYAATSGLHVRACCGTEGGNCPLKTNGVVSVNDRDWKNIKFACPAGTHQLMLMCENAGRSKGACGFDNIRVYAAAESGNPADADVEVC